MRIYTRGGDQGETGLFDGTRVAKSDPRVEAYGAVDELNSLLSLARAAMERPDATQGLLSIQNDLFTVGAQLATPVGKDAPKHTVSPKMVTNLEKGIDHYMKAAGDPSGFILPGESEVAARLHVARTVCRRAERLVVPLAQQETGYQPVVTYLNRLSDLLYAMALWFDKVIAGAKPRPPKY